MYSIRRSAVVHLAVLVLIAWLPGEVGAQWVTQTVPLKPGWNPVHLEVQPYPAACNTVFSNSAVESVWKWDRRFTTIDYVTDPSDPRPEDPHWLAWFPPSNPRGFLTRLFLLEGGGTYLIKVPASAAPFNVAVRGRPVLPRTDWFPHSLNLVGFPVNPVNPPTFADFLRYTPEINASLGLQNQLFRIDTTGRGIVIAQPYRDRIGSGVAYWVQCLRSPSAQGPLDISLPGGELDFGLTGQQLDVTIGNALTNGSLQALVRPLASEPPPAGGGFPEYAGPVPLSCLLPDASNRWQWVEFPADGLTQTIAAGGKWTLRIGVRRNAMTSYTPAGTNGYSYQSILEVTDSGQTLRTRLPVSAGRAQGLPGAALSTCDEHAGLWVGAAALNRVNAPAYTGTNLLDTASPCPLRLLLHVDSNGVVRLLQHAILAWDPAATNAATPSGAFAIYGAESRVPAGSDPVRRLTSVGFPIMEPLALGSGFGSELSGEVAVPFDDPTNPFLHRYHPQHDNKDANFQPYQKAGEAPTLVRTIHLAFENPTNTAASPTWGSERVGGTYREEVNGLRAQQILVEGPFYLERIHRSGELR